MEEQEAVGKVLECFARNGNTAKSSYEMAFFGELADAEWLWEQLRAYRNAEYALLEGNRQPAIELLNHLIDCSIRMGLANKKLYQGHYPLIPLRDALMGIDTPVEPDDPKQEYPTPIVKKLFFRRIIDKFL